MNPLEKTILRALFSNKQFAEKVVPYLKEEYFHNQNAAVIFKLYDKFYQKFHTLPSFAVIKIGLDSLSTLSEQQAKASLLVLEDVEKEPELDATQTAWLVQETEAYCQDRAVYVALQKAIVVMDDPKASKHLIPELMKEALAISFDTHLGHDFFEDAEKRYDFYHRPESRIPFDLEEFNAMTKGGVPRKTLNIVMAGTNIGKSLFLVHQAAASLRLGKNVLYITLEMAEEWIAHRIDANMMDIPMDDVTDLPHSIYVQKMNHLRQSSTGKIIIKEYPTAAGHSGHFRSLLQELSLKQNFKPDVIFVDYLSITASARIKMGNAVNSYTYNKSVAEELRGLAVEFDVPVWTAAQFNREGNKISDPDLTNVGESFAIPQTADFMFALVQTEELEKLNQIIIQPMKNRYAKRNSYQQLPLGIDTSRMKLYELSPAAKQATVSLPNFSSQSNSAQQPSQSTFANKNRRPLKALRKQNPEAETE